MCQARCAPPSPECIQDSFREAAKIAEGAKIAKSSGGQPTPHHSEELEDILGLALFGDPRDFNDPRLDFAIQVARPDRQS